MTTSKSRPRSRDNTRSELVKALSTWVPDECLPVLVKLIEEGNPFIRHELMGYLAKLPDDYEHDDAYDRYREARRASVDQLIKLAPTVKGLLTAEQLRKLPPFLEPRRREIEKVLPALEAVA